MNCLSTPIVRFLFGAILLLAAGDQCESQEPASAKSTADAKTPARPAAKRAVAQEPTNLREMMEAAVDHCQVYASPEAKEPAETEIALRWANNARGSEDGLTLLYIHRGRPLAASCIFPWTGYLMHDFESLTSDHVVARREGTVVWRPESSGVKRTDIPDAPPPEAMRAQRLRQMKSLAEQFQSTLLGWKSDDTDREELRLLPRPLYRYEPRDESLIDGAVFAFVMGTDPESLLLIEAVKDGEASRWQYGFARRTSGELEGRHRGAVVWTAPRFPEERDPRKPHFSFGTPIPAELLSKEEP
ncbi:MAG TPA: hypothetical protein VFW87_12190 [Pirellulales bacterium]|nr:hypothetical protein [Pirellulales bacterium]